MELYPPNAVYLSWPQGLVLGYCVMSLCVFAFVHGQRQVVVPSFPMRVMGVGAMLFILYCGGFFTAPVICGGV